MTTFQAALETLRSRLIDTLMVEQRLSEADATKAANRQFSDGSLNDEAALMVRES